MQPIQGEVSLWAAETFPKKVNNFSVALRASKEMRELLDCLAVDDNSPHAPQELADVVIVLLRLADRLGVDLLEEVQRKLAINKLRVWDEQGQHIPTPIQTNLEQERRDQAEAFWIANLVLDDYEIEASNGWQIDQEVWSRVFFVKNNNPNEPTVSHTLSLVFEPESATIDYVRVN